MYYICIWFVHIQWLLFHLGYTVWRKIQYFSHTNLYRHNVNFRIFNIISVVPLVSRNLITRHYHCSIIFVWWMISIWKTLIIILYLLCFLPILKLTFAIWSHSDKIGKRINNSAESFESKLNKLLKKSNLNFFNLSQN